MHHRALVGRLEAHDLDVLRRRARAVHVQVGRDRPARIDGDAEQPLLAVGDADVGHRADRVRQRPRAGNDEADVPRRALDEQDPPVGQEVEVHGLDDPVADQLVDEVGGQFDRGRGPRPHDEKQDESAEEERPTSEVSHRSMLPNADDSTTRGLPRVRRPDEVQTRGQAGRPSKFDLARPRLRPRHAFVRPLPARDVEEFERGILARRERKQAGPAWAAECDTSSSRVNNAPRRTEKRFIKTPCVGG